MIIPESNDLDIGHPRPSVCSWFGDVAVTPHCKWLSGWWFGTFFYVSIIYDNIWNNPSHWLVFSEGLKPPTSYFSLFLYLNPHSVGDQAWHHRNQGEQLKAIHHASKGKNCLVTKYHKHSMFEPQPETSQVGAIHILLHGKRHPHLCLCAFQLVWLYNLLRFELVYSTVYVFFTGCTISIYIITWQVDNNNICKHQLEYWFGWLWNSCI